METRLMGKRLALAWTAAFIVCNAGIASEADSKSVAKPDDTSIAAGTQIECQTRKRTGEPWPVVNRSRIDQEVAQLNVANGGRDNSLGPPRFLTGSREAAEARNMARVLSEVCTAKAVEEEGPEAKAAKSPARKRAGPR